MALQQERGLATVGPRTISDPTEEAQLTRQLIVKNASEPQFRLLMGICDRYGFDPLLKHVLIVSNNIYVTRDGLLHVAHASKQFDGIAVEMSQTQAGEWVATCTVHRKDMAHPIVYTAFETEHKPNPAPNGSAWQKYPRAMLQKCAEVMALRRAFDVSLGAVEEIGYDATTGRTQHGQARFVEATVVKAAPAQIAAPAPSQFLATLRQMGEDGVSMREIIDYSGTYWPHLTDDEQDEANRIVDAIRVGRKARMKTQAQPRAESAPIEAEVVETPAPKTAEDRALVILDWLGAKPRSYERQEEAVRNLFALSEDQATLEGYRAAATPLAHQDAIDGAWHDRMIELGRAVDAFPAVEPDDYPGDLGSDGPPTQGVFADGKPAAYAG